MEESEEYLQYLDMVGHSEATGEWSQEGWSASPLLIPPLLVRIALVLSAFEPCHGLVPEPGDLPDMT